MELLFLIFILSAIFGGDSKSKKKKAYRRRTKRSDYTDGWGWFHDHGQQI